MTMIFKHELNCILRHFVGCSKDLKHVHECYLCGYFAIVYPTQRGEVGGLRTVEAMIEASMVAIREGDHELSSFLSDLAINIGGRDWFERVKEM